MGRNAFERGVVRRAARAALVADMLLGAAGADNLQIRIGELTIYDRSCFQNNCFCPDVKVVKSSCKSGRIASATGCNCRVR